MRPYGHAINGGWTFQTTLIDVPDATVMPRTAFSMTVRVDSSRRSQFILASSTYRSLSPRT